MAWLASLLFALAVAKPLAPIASESTSLKGHLLPNEFDNHLQYPRDGRGGGAVVAVGTFRAFNVAAAVRGQYLVAFDAATSVGRMSDAIAAAILTHERAAFVGFMLGATRALATREDARIWLHARQQERYLKFSYAPGLFETYRALTEDEDEAAARRNYLAHFEEYFRSSERYAGTFFGSDEAYEHLRELIRAGRYRAVTGRLEGPTAFAEVARALRELGADVSVLDISNALDFVHTRAGVGNFVRNVRLLRFAPAGRVLYTDHNGSWSPFPEFDFLWSAPETLLRRLTLATQASDLEGSLREARFGAARACSEHL